MVEWLRQADSGWLWREYGSKPEGFENLFEEEWTEPMPSASDLDMKVIGKLAWYGVLHQRIADDAVGHIMMAVYRQWPGYRGEEGERKAQYGIKKALVCAFEERERQINSAKWQDSGYTIPEVIFTGTSESSKVVPFPEPPPTSSRLSPTMPRPFPGVMEEIVAFTLKTAPKPQPNLALLSALLAMSSSCSGVYCLPIGSMRLNLYGLGIAETGAGKDQPRCVAVQVAREAGAKVIAKPASGQGLEDQLVSKTPMLVEVDEAAHLFQELNAREQGSSIVMLNAMLLKLYSASKEVYSTRAKALNAKNIASSMPRDVYNPMLNLLGSSTPEKLGEVLTSQNIADGMLGRMVFAIGQSGVQPRRADTQELPASIKEKAIRVKNAAIARNPEQPEARCFVKEIAIRETPDAALMLDALMVKFNDKAEKSDRILGKALFARSFEKCFRIAGVLAVWDDPTEPVIDVRHAEWARDFVNASDSAALKFCDGYFHGGQTQSDGALIVKVIQKILSGQIRLTEERDKKFTKEGYVTHSLVLKNSKLDKKRFDEALAYLEDAGRISRATAEDQKFNGRSHKVKLLRLDEGE
jgi:hypothetical protein